MSQRGPQRCTGTDDDVDDDVYYYICWRLKLEGETENMGVCKKERRKGVVAEVLMPTPSTLVHFLFLFLFLRVIRCPFRTFASLPHLDRRSCEQEVAPEECHSTRARRRMSNVDDESPAAATEDQDFRIDRGDME